MLETERLLLRDFKKSDFKQVHLYGSLPDFSKYEVWGPNSEDDTKKYLLDCINKSKKDPRWEYDFAICEQESNLLVGGCGLQREARRSQIGSIGYSINPDFQQMGYATEAALALIYFGFHHMNLSIIYATCDVRNEASYKVMENIGMTKVGVLENHLKVRGEMRDSYRYEVYNFESEEPEQETETI